MSSVSVVMPAWNAARFIEEAIASALDQSPLPESIIVVDDGSTDDTASLAASIDRRVQVLQQPHAGTGPARTAGVAATTSERIAFLDADDVWLPHKLERQLAVLDADPSVDAVFCLMDEFLDPVHPPGAGVRQPKRCVPAPLSSAAVVSRGLVDRLGPFEASPVGDWVPWWARARAHGVHEKFVPEVLFRRRIHADNSSGRRRADGSAILAIAREQAQATRAKRRSD